MAACNAKCSRRSSGKMEGLWTVKVVTEQTSVTRGAGSSSSTKRRLTMCSNMHFVRPLTKLCHVDSTLYLTSLLRNQDKLLLVQLYILFSFNNAVNIYYTEKIFLNSFRKIMLTVVTVLSHRKQLSDSNMNSAC